MASACVATTSLWLATGLTHPTDIAVDANNVYWSDTTDNTIRAIPKSGGTVVTLAKQQAYPLRVALDDTYVYWANNGGSTVMRAPKDGSEGPSLVAIANAPWGGTLPPLGIVVIGSNVYFTASTELMKAPVTGGMAVSLYSSVNGPFDQLVTDGGGKAVWAAQNHSTGPYGVVEFEVSSGKYLAAAATGTAPVGIVLGVDANYAYYVSSYGGSSTLGWFNSLTMTGGGTVKIGAYPVTSAGGIASSSCAVFTAGVGITGIQMFRPNVGGAPLPVLKTSANRIAYDSSYLYWTDGSGAIGKLPAPP